VCVRVCLCLCVHFGGHEHVRVRESVREHGRSRQDRKQHKQEQGHLKTTFLFWRSNLRRRFFSSFFFHSAGSRTHAHTHADTTHTHTHRINKERDPPRTHQTRMHARAHTVATCNLAYPGPLAHHQRAHWRSSFSSSCVSASPPMTTGLSRHGCPRPRAA
jgi:hypothetical protein